MEKPSENLESIVEYITGMSLKLIKILPIRGLGHSK